MTMASAHSHIVFRLDEVENTSQLARALGVPLDIFRRVVRNKSPRDIYSRHEIPKKNPRFPGEVRIAWESIDEVLARSHKAVARRLDAFIRSKDIGYPHPCVHGYVHGGSTRSNAEPHCGARLLMRVDIQNFFPSITSRQIASSLRSLGMQTVPARELAKFVTIEGTLPLGLPESPVLSNLLALALDKEIEELTKQCGVRYTRYADDITISGASGLPKKSQINSILNRHKFSLSERKFRLSKRGQAHFVTGLSVAERDYPHVPKKMKRQLRQELYYCKKHGLVAHSLVKDEPPQRTFNRLYGLVSYVSFIERRQSVALRDQWRAIVGDEDREFVFGPGNKQSSRKVYLIIDESEFIIGVDQYLAICTVRTDSLDIVNRGIHLTAVDYITTPGSKGDLEILKDVGVHFTDAHYDLRTLAFRTLMELPWSASIHFKRLSSAKEYEETWLELFRTSVRQELITSDGASLEILIERNGKIGQSKLDDVVLEEFQRAEQLESRRPSTNPLVKHVNKANLPAITLPDFILAAFRHNAVRTADERVLDFERVRDRVRYIYDADRNYFYTRKRPFVDINSPRNSIESLGVIE